MVEQDKRMYPQWHTKPNLHPNKWYAFPFFGYFFKLILLIPVFLWFIPLSLLLLFYWLILPFTILFTGTYWSTAYHFTLGYLRLCAKVYLYLAGITDTYPGFALKENEAFTLDFPKPTRPNRWLALPVFGFLIRLFLLIPYLIFARVMSYGLNFAVFLSWFAVVFTGKYPESLYEFNRDSMRVSYSSWLYIAYLSDTYPSFRISMNHKKMKIFLLIIGAVLAILANGGDSRSNEQPNQQSLYEQNYNLPSR